MSNLFRIDTLQIGDKFMRAHAQIGYRVISITPGNPEARIGIERLATYTVESEVYPGVWGFPQQMLASTKIRAYEE